jgi:hypothetical protein
LNEIKHSSEDPHHLRIGGQGNGKIGRNGTPPKPQCNTATPKLASVSNILDEFAKAVEASGLVGEIRAAKLVYLSLTTRFFKRPASLAVKGASSAGKSFVVERTLSFFPPEAYYDLSSVSDMALAYSKEPIAHRFIVIYEWSGLKSEKASYNARTLLSEGKIRHETVETTKEGFRSRRLERMGPTGLIITTTAVSINPENETRLISVPITDSAEQTKCVLQRLATSGDEDRGPDLSTWLELQTWLATQEHRVVIPFAATLATMIPPISVRLRRDFKALLNLIQSHAMLHQAQRQKALDGHIIATIHDYATVRELVVDLFSEGVESTVSPTIRKTVNAVSELCDENPNSPVGVTTVARRLGIDRSSASRRIAAARERGFLKNRETTQKGKQYDLLPGDPLPEDVQILPGADVLRQCCSVADDLGDTPTDDEDTYEEGEV